jgi:hypothetical protein
LHFSELVHAKRTRNQCIAIWAAKGFYLFSRRPLPCWRTKRGVRRFVRQVAALRPPCHGPVCQPSSSHSARHVLARHSRNQIGRSAKEFVSSRPVSFTPSPRRQRPACFGFVSSRPATFTPSPFGIGPAASDSFHRALLVSHPPPARCRYVDAFACANCVAHCW